MSAERIRADLEEILSFEGRGAGTDAERRLSNRLAERVREIGFEAEVEPTFVHPRNAATDLLHCLLALAGGILAVYVPVAGFALVLLVAVSAYLDLNGRLHLIRSLTFRRASQNVYAFPRSTASEEAERLILCANVDAPRGGEEPGLLEGALAPLARRIPWLSGSRVWFWAVALLLIPLGIRAGGIEETWGSALQLLPMLVLIVACFILGDRALSPLASGVNDNATGVAAVLEAARRLHAEPLASLRLELLLIGGGAPAMEGMRRFLRAHRNLRASRTKFVSVQRVGGGEPRYLVAQGPAVSMPVDRRLVAACDAIAADQEAGADRARDGGTSAAHVARVHRYPSIAITAGAGAGVATEACDADAIADAVDLVVALARRIDRDLGGDAIARLRESGEPAAT